MPYKNPEVEFIYSRTYVRVIYGLQELHARDEENERFERHWKIILKQSRKVENLFGTHNQRILTLIPAYTGFRWHQFAEPKIYVYPIKDIPSFSNPLTLHVRSDTVLTLGVFIHELIHTNMSFKFPNEKVQESIITSITLQILKDLSLSTKNYHAFAKEVFEKRFEDKFIREKWTKLKTAKEVLRQKL